MKSEALKTCICPVCGQVFIFDPADPHIIDVHGTKYMLCSIECYDEIMKLTREHKYETVKNMFGI